MERRLWTGFENGLKWQKTKQNKILQIKQNKQLVFFFLPAPISHAASRAKVVTPGAFAQAKSILVPCWSGSHVCFVPCRLL